MFACLERCIGDGHTTLHPIAAAVRIEMAIAAAEDDSGQVLRRGGHYPSLQLASPQGAERGLARLIPLSDPQLRILEFDFDISGFLSAETVAEFPATLSPGPAYIVAFSASKDRRRNPLVVDSASARILMLSDGTRTAGEVVKELAYIITPIRRLKSSIAPLSYRRYLAPIKIRPMSPSAT